MKFMDYVDSGYSFLNSAIKTREYLMSQSVSPDASVLTGVLLYGDYGQKLRSASYYSRSLVSDLPDSEHTIDVFIDDKINQHIIENEVSYTPYSQNYQEIINYIVENIDSEFTIEDYYISESGEYTTGYNSLSFRLLVNGIISNYGFNFVLLDGKAELINFTNTYSKYDDTPNTNISNLGIDLINDELMYQLAIEEDSLEEEVYEQYIEKYVDVETNKIINNVNTVYVDETGCYFTTLNIY